MVNETWPHGALPGLWKLPSGHSLGRYRDASGQQQAAPTIFATKADAYRWLSRAEADMDRREWIDAHICKVTLGS